MLENWVTLRWTTLLARGVVGVAFGTVAMVWPDETVVLSGLVDGLIGVLFLANPGKAALSVAFVLGLCAFVWGIIIVGVALAVRRATRTTTTVATDVAFG